MIVDEVVTGICVSYNTKDLLQRAYESVRKFHLGMQVIIVDGSDSSPEGIKCREYVKSISYNNTISILAVNNIGHGKGICLGLEHVKTPFVLLFDSDIEMLKSPVQDMLDLMEENTYGVGYNEQADLGGHEWGSRKDHMKEGPMKYLHPYFCLIQLKEYKKYQPFIHHGAPAVNTMLDIYRKGLSDKVIKEFPGLGHSAGQGWTWTGSPKEFIRHDSAGTRQYRRTISKEEIEGRWEPVIDKKKITCLTMTGDRPLAFSLSKRWMEQQTVKPTQWIIIDDGVVPENKPDLDFVDYIRREPKSSDPKQTMILNLQEAVKHIDGGKILIIEDDEYYSPWYIEEMSSRLDQHELVGIGRSKYYYLPAFTYYSHPNMGHASLAQTGFTKSFLPDVIDVLDGDPFLDTRIWNIVNPGKINMKETGRSIVVSGDGRGLIFDDRAKSLYVGMKGLPGRAGIGAGHKGVGSQDQNKQTLRSWVLKDEDFQIYMNLVLPTVTKLSPVQPRSVTLQRSRPERFR